MLCLVAGMMIIVAAVWLRWFLEPDKAEMDRTLLEAEHASLRMVPTIVIVLAVTGIVIYFGRKQLSRGMPNMPSLMMGEADYQAERPKERFFNVYGADEAIDEARDLVDYMLHPEEYAGIKMERGVIFHGPTGTGKTLLAKATAGEAGVPFHHLSGSDLTSQWVGGTTQRIIGFFDNIKKKQKTNEPCVVFIDELDGIAGKRRDGYQAADDDSNKSLTQLLHQIPLFFEHFPLAILIGATNRFDSLDDAIKRPDRLGLHIAVPNPDLAARKVLLERNCANLALNPNASLGAVAGLTFGMSGAQVAAVPSKAALVARRRRRPGGMIQTHDIEQAAMEIAMGTLRWSAAVTTEDRALSDIHEAGHAVVAQRSEYHQLAVVTDVPISATGGSTWAPPVERMAHTLDSLLWTVALMMGGRESEIMHYGEASSGAQGDLDSASNVVLTAICEWGIIEGFQARINVNRWEEHPRAAEISAKVEKLLERGSRLARKVLEENRAFRQAIINRLDERRIIHSDEIDALDPQPNACKVYVADSTEPAHQR